ncbi:MAG: guanylate kinase [Lachnospiraceae bacterium]|nr:guanylate kinase [Lachnospiraceae bacterium]
MNKRGVLTVISGFSGAGKGTLVKELVRKYDYKLSVSATTRQPREGECDGKDYFFLTTEKFESMIENGQFFEWAKYVGNYYGTPREFVEQQLNEGNDVILEIEIQGALKMKEQFPDILLLFITPPNAEELKNRLVRRNTEDMETITKRLKRAEEEAEFMDRYDYIDINDDLDECVQNTHTLIQNYKAKTSNCADFIREMQAQLKKLNQ